MRSKKKWLELLDDHEACHPALRYVKRKKSFKEAWKGCTRGEWLAWLLSVFPPELSVKDLYKILVECFWDEEMFHEHKNSLFLVAREEKELLLGIRDVLLRWTEGDVGVHELMDIDKLVVELYLLKVTGVIGLSTILRWIWGWNLTPDSPAPWGLRQEIFGRMPGGKHTAEVIRSYISFDQMEDGVYAVRSFRSR